MLKHFCAIVLPVFCLCHWNSKISADEREFGLAPNHLPYSTLVLSGARRVAVDCDGGVTIVAGLGDHSVLIRVNRRGQIEMDVSDESKYGRKSKHFRANSPAQLKARSAEAFEVYNQFAGVPSPLSPTIDSPLDPVVSSGERRADDVQRLRTEILWLDRLARYYPGLNAAVNHRKLELNQLGKRAFQQAFGDTFAKDAFRVGEAF